VSLYSGVVVDTDRFLLRVVGPVYGALAARPDLAAVLGDLWVRARVEWPELELSQEAFLDHVAERVPPDADGNVLGELFAADLYLAAACFHREVAAIVACERAHADDIERGFDSLGATPGLREETWQRLRERIFVGVGDQPPAIGSFTGRGSLRKWLRVAATRLALNVIRSQRRETPLDQAPDLEDAADDLELGHFKRTYQAAFKQAFGEALGSLTAEKRTLLRMHLLDKMTIDDIAALHHVHRTSAARWLREARADLADGTRERLRVQLGIAGDELESVMKIVRSRLDLSLTRLFADG
jgi:RNA polymerase sigma-70 factor (ECF subfamily)